jgi:hypothetical protein
VKLRDNVFFLLLAACAAVVSLALAGCGGGGGGGEKPPPAAGPDAPGAPAMLGQALRPGEVMVDAEASPQRQGPYEFSGRYRVRFVQYAPEAPGRSFAGATPFVAGLVAADRPRAKPVPLFHAAAKAGARTVGIEGRYFVEVAFGDFPYAMRFTPIP